MIYVLLSALYLWAFWYAYILVMGVYRAHLAGRLTKLTFALAMPAVVVGYAMDILCQYTVATLVFLDLPASNEHLVTDRLQRYVADGIGWRSQLSDWICSNLLDVFDPKGNHC